MQHSWAFGVLLVGLAAAPAESLESRVAGKDTVVVQSGKLRDTPVGNGDAEENPLANYTSPDADAKLLKIYQDGFREKRIIQIATAESLAIKNDYAKQYALAKVVVDPIFRLLRQAQKNLTGVDLDALPPIPNKNRTLLVSLVNVWEGTAMLGDLILRLPDILHRMVDGHALRLEVLGWAARVCASSKMYEPTHRKQLELVLQEMSLADVPDTAYSNPFSEVARRQRAADHGRAKAAQEKEIERLIRKRSRRAQLSRPRQPPAVSSPP